MGDLNVSSALSEPLGDPIGDRNRSMTATGTSDGHGQIRFSLGLVPRNQEVEQRQKTTEEFLGLLALQHKLRHCGVVAGLVLERINKKWVR